MSDLKYRVAFNRIPRIGRVRFTLMEKHFGTLDKAWSASPSELKASGLDDNTVQAIASSRPSIDPETEMDRLQRADARALDWHSPEYPPLLKEIYDPPPLLYVKGSLLPQDQRAVAVVGTRRSTAYGREACSRLTSDLARAGVTVISGLALGIDAVAHSAALEAGGRTIAVMATGLDIIYPAQHRGLAQDVARTGALVTEHPLGTRPNAQTFPRRNRIISGMALGVLVPEAPVDSGAMWTVRHALEQGRDVFAVPGSIFSPVSSGTNRLIQDGAKLVLTVRDILEELNLATAVMAQPPAQLPLTTSGGDETRILTLLGTEPIHIDDLQHQTGMPIANISSLLAIMEINGLIRQTPGMHFIRAGAAASGL